MLKKKPYLVKLFCTLEEGKQIDDFFTEKNADLMPSYVQDCIGSCDVFEENDFHYIIIIDDLSMDYIKSVLKDRFDINFEIKDATKEFLLGEYPFELSVGQKRAVEEIVLDNVTPDDILDKINTKGIQALSEQEEEILKNYLKL
jgi:dihydropteroate synthase